MSTGKVVLGTLAGLAIGAIAGILFAPDKGSVTRRKLKDSGNDYLDDMKSKFDEFSESISGRFENAKKEGAHLAENGKSKFDEVKRDVKNSALEFNQSVL
jgi:gas vesicle protein